MSTFERIKKAVGIVLLTSLLQQVLPYTKAGPEMDQNWFQRSDHFFNLEL